MSADCHHWLAGASLTPLAVLGSLGLMIPATRRNRAVKNSESIDLSKSGTSDEQLLLDYRDHGDVGSFESLVHRYEKPIYNYLLRYLRNGAMAEDVFQATFLRVHEKCHLYDGRRKVRPWLYSIATHQAIDAMRREGRHPAVSRSPPPG